MKSLLLGAACLAFAACGSDDPMDPNDPNDPSDPSDPSDPTDPTDPDTSALDRDNLASVIGAHIRAELSLQIAATALSRGQTVDGYSMSSVTLEESRGVGNVGGMSYEFSLICHDAQIPHQPQFCDGTAHHSHFKVTAMGSQSVGSMSISGINRVVDWEIRDISLGKSRFRGPDDVTLSTQVDGAAFEISFDATYEQVRYSVGRDVPTFGTIDFSIAAERTRNGNVRNFSATARVEFTNTGASLVLDGQSYRLDLATGLVTKL